MAAIVGVRYLALIGLTYLASALLYSRLPEPYCGPGCGMPLARPLIAFALPTAMAVVVGGLGLLWMRDPIRDRDAHTESTYDAIIAMVVFLILGIHALVLIALTTELQRDVVQIGARAVPVIFGLTLIVIGNLLPRLRPNLVIGIRTARTLADRGVWARVNRTAGYAAVFAGSSFVLGGLLPGLPVMEFATVAALGVMTAFVWSSWRSRHAVIPNPKSLRDIVTRFAPAPTGYLHLGHVLNAIYVWETARASGADSRVLLRIEDHDRERSRPEFEAALLDDLAWLGFAADGPLTRQSERSDLYERALDGLRARGLTYACECSRSEIGSGRYPGTCRHKNLPETSGLGIRVRLDATAERFDDLRLGPLEQRPSEQCGDLLARDRRGNWTYQFAVVVDDWLQNVNLVIRGEDLLDSTGRQIQLARLVGREHPTAFLHHALLMKTATQKLSKSDGDTGVRDLRAKGWSAEGVIDRATSLAGLSHDDVRRLRTRMTHRP